MRYEAEQDGMGKALVALSVILSFVFLHGLYGVREGTVAAALCVGVVSKLISPRLKKASGRLLKI